MTMQRPARIIAGMQNADVVKIFEELADLLEIQNANPFRVRAYRNAARTLGDSAGIARRDRRDPERNLEDLPGIGHDLAEKIKTILTTGSLPQLEELRSQVPRGVVEMLRIQGLGPKKAAAPVQGTVDHEPRHAQGGGRIGGRGGTQRLR